MYKINNLNRKKSNNSIKLENINPPPNISNKKKSVHKSKNEIDTNNLKLPDINSSRKTSNNNMYFLIN